jgi:hypothetical protein
MALSFPLNPTIGQKYQTGSSAEYEFNGSYWTVVQPSAIELINAVSASYAETASHVLGTSETSSYSLTASFAEQSISASYALTASHLLGASETSSYALTASFVEQAVSASYSVTSSFADRAVSSSYALTSSFSDQAASSSYALTSSFADSAISASYSLTASYVNPLEQAVKITGSLEVAGDLTVVGAATFITVTASNVIVDQNIITVYGSGSNLPLAGFIAEDTGSTYPSGSFLFNLPDSQWESNFPVVAPSFIGTASYASTASLADQAISASYSLTASHLLNAPEGGASVTISTTVPSESKESGSLWWNEVEGNLYIQVKSPTGSVYVPATNTVAGGNYGATVTSPNTGSVWNINHNLNTTTPLVTIYSGSSVMIPAAVRSINANNTQITFSGSVQGTAVLSTGIGNETTNNAVSASYATTAENISETAITNANGNYIDIGNVRYQWGTRASGDNARTVVFPAAFRNTDYSFTANVEAADYSARTVNLGTKATTNILVRVTAGGNGSNAPFSWTAIGLKP